MLQAEGGLNTTDSNGSLYSNRVWSHYHLCIFLVVNPQRHTSLIGPLWLQDGFFFNDSLLQHILLRPNVVLLFQIPIPLSYRRRKPAVCLSMDMSLNDMLFKRYIL